MSSILYYSKYCEISKKYLQILSKMNVQKDVHFICIDKREKDANNKTYIILDNGQKIILPENITKVPALLLLNKSHHVIFGDDINKHLDSQNVTYTNNTNKVVQMNGEPMAFSLSGNTNGYGVASDNFSFLDQDSNSLSAKGDGGMRQQHHYADINFSDLIETPPDTYSPDKIGNVSMEQLQQRRQNDIKK